MNAILQNRLISKIKKWTILIFLICLIVAALRPFLLRCALLSAIKAGNIAAVQTLLKAGADANTYDFDGKPTVLLATCYFQRTDIINLLLNYGADINAKCEQSQETALCVASSSRSLNISELLVARGADVNLRDFHDTTPLMHAAIEEDEPTIRLLLNHGADATAKDGFFETALDYANDYPRNRELIHLLQGAMQKNLFHMRTLSSHLAF